ncbi:MAG TPA: EFR1 family ferrodoxin [Oscillospiraceae bacterium]|nr:EFR1 family ferrodoxin [Oscillospiraceae bacterium]
MQYKRVTSMFFSPTGGTERMTKTVAEALGRELGLPVTHSSFTLPQERETPRAFTAEDIVVIGTPVYAGRVPNVLLKYLATIRGGGAAAVPVVAFGNRAYDDALTELRDIMTDAGCKAAGAGAFVCAHVFSETLGAGRPDETDLALARDLAQGVARKLEARPLPEEPLRVRGRERADRVYFQSKDLEGKPVSILKVKPQTGESCTNCGFCATVCPVGAIDPDDVRKFRTFCIKCCACIKKCPQHARYFDDPGFISHLREIERTHARRAQSEIFV